MPVLYVVATPIGNLSEASPRMLDTLRAVGLIAAEDTRVTGGLLRHFDIRTPMTSMHRHNEEAKAPGVIARMLAENIDVALVTDAGTPGISDPGHALVRQAIGSGIAVQPIAGPCAMAAALSISGFDTRTFAFWGFLPRETGDLKRRLLDIARQAPVAVLYESPHRIIALMRAIGETLPGCVACVCCDLTKLYEKTLRGDPAEVLRALEDNPKAAKGEYCVVLDLHGVALPEAPLAAIGTEARLLDLMVCRGHSLRDAQDALAAEGVRKNEVKRAALRVRAFLAETDAP